MADNWYNSMGISLAGAGLGAFLLLTGIGSCDYLTSRSSRPFLQNTPQVQTADLNQNGKPETFYTIEGKVAVTEADGEPIIDFLKKGLIKLLAQFIS